MPGAGIADAAYGEERNDFRIPRHTDCRDRESFPADSAPTATPVCLRRKPGASGECAECKRKRRALQRKLAINQPGDQYEVEADRVAAAVDRRNELEPAVISSLGKGRCSARSRASRKARRRNTRKRQKRSGEAFLEKSPGKEIEKKAEELGKALHLHLAR